MTAGNHLRRFSPVVMEHIVADAAALHGIGVSRMLARTHGTAADRTAFAARALAIRAARRRGYSFAKIAQGLDGRDHTTVLHTLRRAAELGL